MVPSNSDAILLVSPEKEYKLSPVKEALVGNNTAAREIERWKNALEFAISRANKFDAKVTGGWLQKRGGKGHKVQNSKRRYFVLRGNLLQYYSEPKEKTNDISTLKGYMDIAKIVDLEIVTGGNPSDFRFRIVTSDYKEFILQAKDEADRNRWIESVDRQIKLLEDHEFQVSYNLQETITKHGKLSRADIFPKPASAVANLVCLSQVSLRFYPNSLDISSVNKDIAKEVSLVIPLLGAYCGLDNQTNRILLVDSMGNSYSIYAKDRETNKQWEAEIQAGIVNIAKQHITLGSNLRFSCYVQTQANGPEETAIIIVNDQGLSIEMLQSKTQLRIDMTMFVGLSFANAEAFMLKYYAKGMPHTDDLPPTSITVRTTNAAGIYSMVGAAVEGLKGENIVSRKRFDTKPNPNKKGRKKKRNPTGGKKKTTSMISRPSGMLSASTDGSPPGAAPPTMVLPSDFDVVMANRRSVLPKMTAATVSSLPPGMVGLGSPGLTGSQKATIHPVSYDNEDDSEDEESDEEGDEEPNSPTAGTPAVAPIPVPGGLLIPHDLELVHSSVRMSVPPGVIQAMTEQAQATEITPRADTTPRDASGAPIALPPPPPPEDYGMDEDDSDETSEETSEESADEPESMPLHDPAVSYVPPPPPDE